MKLIPCPRQPYHKGAIYHGYWCVCGGKGEVQGYVVGWTGLIAGIVVWTATAITFAGLFDLGWLVALAVPASVGFVAAEGLSEFFRVLKEGKEHERTVDQIN